jgi:hypothetical protein
MQQQPLPSAPPIQLTLAFHFRYIMPGEFLDSNKVVALLLARVFRAFRKDLKMAGSVLVRAGHLILTEDLRSPLETALRKSHIRTGRQKFRRGLQHGIREYLVPLDRTFAVVAIGRLQGFQEKWSKRLRSHARHPFLFSLEVDSEDSTLERIYLRRNIAVGEVRQDWSTEIDLEAMGFEPDIFEMLEKLGMTEALSAPGMRTLLDMLAAPLSSSRRSA